MVNYGVIWFNKDWLFDLECKIHQRLLVNVRTKKAGCCNVDQNVYLNLQSALSGKCKSCGGKYWVHDSEIKLEMKDMNHIDTPYDEIYRKYGSKGFF